MKMAAPMMTSVGNVWKTFPRLLANAKFIRSNNHGMKWVGQLCCLLQNRKRYNTDRSCDSEKPVHLPEVGVVTVFNPALQTSPKPQLNRDIGLKPGDQTWRAILTPDTPPGAKILRLAIIGPPNSGKSTLTNQLMGWRVSSVSKKVHTTRKRILGVFTEGCTQIVFLDTPGIIEPRKRHKHNLEKALVTDPYKSFQEADIVAVIVDASHQWNRDRLDHEILKALHLNPNIPSVLVLNKTDSVRDKRSLLVATRKLTEGIVGGIPTDKRSKKKKKKTMAEIISQSDNNSISLDDKLTISKISGDRYRSDLNEETNAMSYERTRKISENENSNESASLDVSKNGSSQREQIDNGKHNKNTIECIEQFGQYMLEDSARDTNENFSQSGKKYITHGINSPSGVAECPDSQSEDMLHVEYNQSDRSWMDYHARMKEIRRVIRDKDGWAKFDRVFMVSALTGDGIPELKEHLLSCAETGDWVYHSSLVTDQDPVDIAKACVWEKLLDELKDEIPYNLDLDVVLWDAVGQDFLRVVIDVSCYTKRHFVSTLGPGGATIRKVSMHAEQEMMNAFHCEVQLKVQVQFRQTRKKR